MQLVGKRSRKKRNYEKRRALGKHAVLDDDSEYKLPLSYYDKPPQGKRYQSVDLELMIQTLRERQTALSHIESMR